MNEDLRKENTRLDAASNAHHGLNVIKQAQFEKDIAKLRQRVEDMETERSRILGHMHQGPLGVHNVQGKAVTLNLNPIQNHGEAHSRLDTSLLHDDTLHVRQPMHSRETLFDSLETSVELKSIRRVLIELMRPLATIDSLYHLTLTGVVGSQSNLGLSQHQPPFLAAICERLLRICGEQVAQTDAEPHKVQDTLRDLVVIRHCLQKDTKESGDGATCSRQEASHSSGKRFDLYSTSAPADATPSHSFVMSPVIVTGDSQVGELLDVHMALRMAIAQCCARDRESLTYESALAALGGSFFICRQCMSTCFCLCTRFSDQDARDMGAFERFPAAFKADAMPVCSLNTCCPNIPKLILPAQKMDVGHSFCKLHTGEYCAPKSHI